MKMNWDSLLEPIFLFILALIAGTLWVIVPTDPQRDAELQNDPVVSEAPDRRDDATRTDPTDGKMQLATAAQLVKTASLVQTASVEREISTVTEAIRDSAERSQLTTEELHQLQTQNQQLESSVGEERQALEKLNAQLGSLEQRQKETQARVTGAAQSNQAITTETEALRRLLTEREAEAGRLAVRPCIRPERL